MQPRSSFDRALLMLVAIGVVSILGTGCILLTSDLGKPLLTPTATPSGFSSPEARMLTPSPATAPIQDEAPPAAIEASPPGSPAETLPPTSTLITESLSTPSATLTPHQLPLVPYGKYDDTDPNIAYDRYWVALKNPSTVQSYKGTIHFSTAIGNEASFRFIGKQFLLGYQRGKNFGIVTVIIDDQSYSFHEEAFDLVWRSPQLSPGDHFVRIVHESGQSINLDYIEILH